MFFFFLHSSVGIVLGIFFDMFLKLFLNTFISEKKNSKCVDIFIDMLKSKLNVPEKSFYSQGVYVVDTGFLKLSTQTKRMVFVSRNLFLALVM